MRGEEAALLRSDGARTSRRLHLLGTWLTPPVFGSDKGPRPNTWSLRSVPPPAACASSARLLRGDFARRDAGQVGFRPRRLLAPRREPIRVVGKIRGGSVSNVSMESLIFN